MRATTGGYVPRTILATTVTVFALTCVFANSFLVTIEQKVAACTAILRITISEAAPPMSRNEPAVCKANVLEVLKGPSDLKNVEFRFHPDAVFSGDKSPMIGTEYYVFLHTPYTNQFWVFEGPRGLRPITNEYQELRLVDGKVVYDTYSRSNYVAKIRELVAKSKKSE